MGVYFSSKSYEALDGSKVSLLVGGALSSVAPQRWRCGHGALTKDEVRRVISNVAFRLRDGEFARDIINHEQQIVDGQALLHLSKDCRQVFDLIEWQATSEEETLCFG